jgi:sarcosine oxidase gamma subunit
VSAFPADYRIEARASLRMLEFAAFGGPLPESARAGWDQGWPLAPGGAQFVAGEPRLLHFAPGRWFAPAATPEIQALFAAASARGDGTPLDVTGKWCGFDIAGTAAGRLLAFSLDVDAALAGRDCAAVTLLDCPAIIARPGANFIAWVQSSYARHFSDTARACGATLQRNR